MKTRFLSFLTMLLLTVGGRAADEQQLLVVNFIDGTSLELALSETPRLQFPDTRIVVEAGTFAAEYQRYRIKDIHFANAVDVDAIVMPQTDSRSQWRIDYTRPDEVIVTGPMEGRSVSLYSVGGARIDRHSAMSPSSCRLSLAGLSAGTYIVSVDGVTSFKIIVR